MYKTPLLNKYIISWIITLYVQTIGLLIFHIYKTKQLFDLRISIYLTKVLKLCQYNIFLNINKLLSSDKLIEIHCAVIMFFIIRY